MSARPSMVPRCYGPSGVSLDGSAVWRSFASMQDWIDKAPSWVRRGDVCIDSRGEQMRRGADFATAQYPVFIARPTP